MVNGVIPALLTPFTAEGKEVDVPGLKRLCDHLAGMKVGGLFVTGTTGEFVLLSPDERRLVIREVLRHVNHRLTVLVHIGSYNTAESVALTKFAKDHGADGIGCMPPYFYTLDDDALFAHFSRICEEANGLPVFLYNIPGTAINEISLPVIRRLKERYPHVRGIKESSGDMKRLESLVEMGLPNFTVINGSDEHTLTALRMGVHASVSSTANAFSDAFDDIYDAFDAGDQERAKLAQGRLFKLTEVLRHGRYLACYKQALAWRGVDVGTVRPPHRELTAEECDELRAGLTGLKMI